ncbi:hypothetical protein [Chondromyces crocatus]|nr:hypothetical protein [Chondromyces crocatus]
MVLLGRASAPHRCRLLTEVALRHVIQHAITRASTHRFTQRGPVRLHVELALLLGSGFDGDPQLPWAAAALGVPDLDQSYRAEALHRGACAYFEALGRETPGRTGGMLERLAAFAEGARVAGPGRVEDEALRVMAALDAEKATYVGEASLRQLVARASGTCGGLPEASRSASVVMLAGLMFVFGHQCDEDAMHPWIAASLGAEEASRGEVLVGAIRRWAARWRDEEAGFEPPGGNP